MPEAMPRLFCQVSPMDLVTELEVQHAPMPHHLAGLSYTRSGYGSKIPTRWKVRIKGRNNWNRLYVRIYSNSGTSFIRVKGETIVVRDY